MQSKKNKVWALLGGLAFLLLNYPLLHIPNEGRLVAGLPLLWVYIFCVWLLAIVGLFGLSRQISEAPPEEEK